MPKTCWAPGCKSGYPGILDTSKRHFWAPGCKSGYPGILDTSKRHFFQDPVVKIENNLHAVNAENSLISCGTCTFI